jgi:hypothetical protein
VFLASFHDEANGLDYVGSQFALLRSIHGNSGEKLLKPGHKLVVESGELFIEYASNAGEQSESLLLQLSVVSLDTLSKETG